MVFNFALKRNHTLREQSLFLVLQAGSKQLSNGEIQTNYYKKEHNLKRAEKAMRPSAMRKQKLCCAIYEGRAQ